MSQLFSQLQTIASLYAEVLACIVAAGLFGWIVGLMMQRSRYRQKLARCSEHWLTRYESLEATARVDTENLEEQLQSMAKETKTLQARNRTITDSLKKNDINIQKARAEAIELNRLHSETHESLQRAIEEKDIQITELCNRLNIDPLALSDTQTGYVASLTNIALADGDLANADTIAITTAQLPINKMNALNRKPAKTTRNSTHEKCNKAIEPDPDSSLDDTSDLSEFGLEESTIAMDEDALGIVQQSFKSQRRD